MGILPGPPKLPVRVCRKFTLCKNCFFGCIHNKPTNNSPSRTFDTHLATGASGNSARQAWGALMVINDTYLSINID